MKFICYCSFFLLCGIVWGQTPYGKHLNTRNGMPSSEVYRVVFDNEGMAWFATDRGLCRYNGHELKVFTTEDGLRDNTVLSILKDSQKRLWFVSLGGQLSYMDQGKIKAYAGNDSLTKYGPVNGLINHLHWDEQENLYARFNSTQGHLFLKINKEPGVQPKYVEFDDLFPPEDIIKVGKWTFGNLGNSWVSKETIKYWLVTDSTVYFFRTECTHCLYKVDRTTGEEKIINTPSTALGITRDAKGRFWLHTRNGLLRFYPETNSFDNKYLFMGKGVTDIKVDAEGVFWISMLEDGVYVIPSMDITYSREDFSHTPTFFHPLESGLLIGTLDGEVWLRRHSGAYQRLLKNPEMAGRLSHISEKNGVLMAAIYRFNEEQGEIRIDSVNSHLMLPVGLSLPNGETLLAGQGGYRTFKNNLTQKISRKITARFLKRIFCAEWVGDRVWIGTLEGVWEITGSDYQHTRRLFPFDPRYNCRINKIITTGNGHVWMASVGNGLLFYDGKQSYQVKDELNSLMINSIYAESDSILWVGTNQGLNRIRYEDSTEGFTLLGVDAITVADGLPDNFIRAVTIWEGEVWVSGQEGIAHFQASEVLNKDIPPPKVLIEEVWVDTQIVDHRRPLELKHHQNDLSIHFSSISQYPPINQPAFRYRLEGSNQAWVYTQDRQITLYDLAPGQYIFEVEARNREGAWSLKPSTFEFNIQPHFTQTLVFKMAVVGFLALLLIGFFWFRLRRIMRRNQQERALQEAQLRTKEAELTILRNQMNPHFVFNALNAIQTYIFDQDPEKANYYLSRFSHLMRNALQFSSHQRVRLRDEIDFLETYLELEAIRFPGVFVSEITIQKDLDQTNLWLPPFLLQPLLENAVKHAFKGIDYLGKLEVHIRESKQGGLLIRVSDNGKGQSSDPQPRPVYYKSMGLDIIKNRIQLLSEGGETATFELRDKSKEQNGQGMEVLISLPATTVCNEKEAMHA